MAVVKEELARLERNKTAEAAAQADEMAFLTSDHTAMKDRLASTRLRLASAEESLARESERLAETERQLSNAEEELAACQRDRAEIAAEQAGLRVELACTRDELNASRHRLGNATYELAATYRRSCLASAALSNELAHVKGALEGLSLVPASHSAPAPLHARR